MLKKQLWTTCQQTSHQETVENRAATIYRKLVKRMKQAANYGETELEAPPPHENEYVQTALERMLCRDGLFINTNGIISWKPLPAEEQIPVLTARDLIQAGYDPSDGDLFRRILFKLKEAIVRGEVPHDVLQAQIVWVSANFRK